MANRDDYPAPRTRKPRAKRKSNEPDPVLQYQERIFRAADLFNVFRFGTHNGSEVCTVKSFAEAVCIAHAQPRSLIYAVNSFTSESFCCGQKDWNHWARLWLERNPPKRPTAKGKK